ncbi:hypothetical protein AB205_0175330, partial [Aquarana catesbeiana]
MDNLQFPGRKNSSAPACRAACRERSLARRGFGGGRSPQTQRETSQDPGDKVSKATPGSCDVILILTPSHTRETAREATRLCELAYARQRDSVFAMLPPTTTTSSSGNGTGHF